MPRHFLKCPNTESWQFAKSMVGPTGFEPATSTTPWWRATGLRYGPKNPHSLLYYIFLTFYLFLLNGATDGT